MLKASPAHTTSAAVLAAHAAPPRGWEGPAVAELPHLSLLICPLQELLHLSSAPQGAGGPSNSPSPSHDLGRQRKSSAAPDRGPGLAWVLCCPAAGGQLMPWAPMALSSWCLHLCAQAWTLRQHHLPGDLGSHPGAGGVGQIRGQSSLASPVQSTPHLMSSSVLLTRSWKQTLTPSARPRERPPPVAQCQPPAAAPSTPMPSPVTLDASHRQGESGFNCLEHALSLIAWNMQGPVAGPPVAEVQRSLYRFLSNPARDTRCLRWTGQDGHPHLQTPFQGAEQSALGIWPSRAHPGCCRCSGPCSAPLQQPREGLRRHLPTTPRELWASQQGPVSSGLGRGAGMSPAATWS